jgi:hypothetical protein
VSTVYDATELTVDNETVLDLTNSVTTVTISDVTTVPDLTIDVANTVDTVQVEVPGPQGVKNVYVQSNDPAVEYGWGANQANFIWIETSV